MSKTARPLAVRLDARSPREGDSSLAAIAPARVLSLAVVLALVLAASAVALPAQPIRKPNILLITLDTTRADRLGCYGYARKITPNLDRLAAEGALFTHATCQASVTPVSHASIFTGLYPFNHGLRVMHGHFENRLDESHVTIAEVFRDAGYNTAAFVSAFPVSRRFGLDQGFTHFDADFQDGGQGPVITPKGTVSSGAAQRRADTTTDAALAWLVGARAPHFVWIHYFDPHDPVLRPPPEVMDRLGNVKGSEEDVLRAIYDSEVMFMDDQIGRIVDALKAAGTWDETLVVVVADHGEGLGDHSWWTHGILYEEQVHVPLILRGPGVKAGLRIDDSVATIDIMPTVLELASVPRGAAPKPDGRSLVPLMRGGKRSGTPIIYSDSVNMLTYRTSPRIEDAKNDMLFAVTDGTWKYIHHLLRENESELYNLRLDPRELTNLYAGRPDVVKHLRDNLKAFPFQPVGQFGDRERMSPEDLERLRSLGYIGG